MNTGTGRAHGTSHSLARHRVSFICIVSSSFDYSCSSTTACAIPGAQHSVYYHHTSPPLTAELQNPIAPCSTRSLFIPRDETISGATSTRAPSSQIVSHRCDVSEGRHFFSPPAPEPPPKAPFSLSTILFSPPGTLCPSYFSL